jgi:hypothetical protein
MRSLAIVCGLATPVAADEPCQDAVVDPIATPLRETDGQRSACLRDELSVGMSGHALVDTPNFHGVLGGDLALAGRLVAGDRLELGARLRVVDYTFAQTAVNKVTATRFGPLALGAAFGLPFEGAQLALVAVAELPYTRDEMETVHASGQLGVAFTGALSRRVVIHARFGAVGAVASSSGGETHRFALRAGTDLAWRLRQRLSVSLGADAEAGWRDGFSTLLVRAGLHWRFGGGSYRMTFGAGAPLGGDEPTTAILTVGLARDLR